MVANFVFAGLDDSAALEAAVRRWIQRLESVHHLTRCEVSIRIGTTLFGFGRRAKIELDLASSARTVTVHRVDRFHDETELFFAISNAFRDAHHQLEHGPAATHPG